MNPFEGDYKVDGQLEFVFTERESEKICEIEQEGVEVEEPKMVQF